jgi:hypothetical protein
MPHTPATSDFQIQSSGLIVLKCVTLPNQAVHLMNDYLIC